MGCSFAELKTYSRHQLVNMLRLKTNILVIGVHPHQLEPLFLNILNDIFDTVVMEGSPPLFGYQCVNLFVDSLIYRGSAYSANSLVHYRPFWPRHIVESLISKGVKFHGFETEKHFPVTIARWLAQKTESDGTMLELYNKMIASNKTEGYIKRGLLQSIDEHNDIIDVGDVHGYAERPSIVNKRNKLWYDILCHHSSPNHLCVALVGSGHLGGRELIDPVSHTPVVYKGICRHLLDDIEGKLRVQGQFRLGRLKAGTSMYIGSQKTFWDERETYDYDLSVQTAIV